MRPTITVVQNLSEATRCGTSRRGSAPEDAVSTSCSADKICQQVLRLLLLLCSLPLLHHLQALSSPLACSSSSCFRCCDARAALPDHLSKRAELHLSRFLRRILEATQVPRGGVPSNHGATLSSSRME